MNPATILITRPRKEGDPTAITYEWAGNVVKLAEDMGYNVIDLSGSKANYDNVSQIVSEYKPRVYIHYGHGCSTSLQGQTECIVTRRFGVDELVSMPNFKQIISPLRHMSGCQYACKLDSDPCSPICMNETNIGLFRNTIMFAVACYSGEQLGRCAEKYGVASYCGYDDLFLFPSDDMKTEDLFGDVQFLYAQKLLEGYTVSEAEKIVNAYEDELIKLHKRTKFTALPLLWNKKHRKIYGDKGISIYGK